MSLPVCSSAKVISSPWSWLGNKYSRKVTTELDSAIKAEYSDLSKNYRLLSVTLKQDARRFSGTGLNAFGGGLTVTDIETKRANDNRVHPSFTRDRFRAEDTEYLKYDYEQDQWPSILRI